MLLSPLGRRHLPQRAHHNFQPAGDLAVRIFKTPCPAALMVELGSEPVALGGEPVAFVGERAKLLFEL